MYSSSLTAHNPKPRSSSTEHQRKVTWDGFFQQVIAKEYPHANEEVKKIIFLIECELESPIRTFYIDYLEAKMFANASKIVKQKAIYKAEVRRLQNENFTIQEICNYVGFTMKYGPHDEITKLIEATYGQKFKDMLLKRRDMEKLNMKTTYIDQDITEAYEKMCTYFKRNVVLQYGCMILGILK